MHWSRVSFRQAAAVLTFAFLLLSCSRGSAPSASVERIAVFPLENLSNDAALDWASSASSAILAYDLTGPRDVNPVETGSIRDARLKNADRYLEGYFASRGGSLEFHATIESPAKLKMERTVVLSAPQGSLIDAMNRLARDLTPNARQFPPCKVQAIRLYAEALQGNGSFEGAVQADSNCAPLYLALAESLGRQGDRAGAARVTASALQMPGLDAIARTQLQYVNATVKNDPAARLEALRRLTSLLPANVELLHNIAANEFSDRNFTDAARSLEAAVRADPNDSQTWNTLGYARACAHDLKGAREALETYQKLLPAGETNGLDSLGEVSFFLGDFASAEKYFLEAQGKNPAEFGGRELLKAAEARMMTGDLAEADKIFARVPNWAPLDRAQWEFLTGRRKQAMATVTALQDPRAALQLSLWKAQTGLGPVPQNAAEPLGRAVSLLLSARFAEAAPILEQLYHASNPGADGQVRTLLAWAYAQTGRKQDAAKLLDRYPIPLGADGEPLLSSLVFPRFVQLRADILNSPADRQLAAKYAGD